MRYKPKRQEDGAKRVIQRFAWIPQHLDDDVWVWLERYLVSQKYLIYDAKIYGWVPTYRKSIGVT